MTNEEEFDAILLDALNKQVQLICIEVRGCNAEILYHSNDQLITTKSLWSTEVVNRFAGSVYALIATDNYGAKMIKTIDKPYKEFKRQIAEKMVFMRVTTIPAHCGGFDCVINLNAVNTL